MVPRLVCSLIRHNNQHGHQPVCITLLEENSMLHASIERLVKENDKLLDIIKKQDIIIEALQKKSWWRKNYEKFIVRCFSIVWRHSTGS